MYCDQQNRDAVDMDTQCSEIIVLLQRASCLASIELQRAGFVPTPGEREVIQGISIRLSNELARLALGDHPSPSLEALRERVTSQLNVNRSIAAPVRRLPSELLSEIFLVLDTTTSRAEMIAKTIAPVCVLWRTTAYSTPRLWSSISSLSTRHSASYDYARHAALAGDLPLHIWASDKSAGDILSQLRPYAARWETLFLAATCQLVESQPTLDFPMLRKVEFWPSRPSTSDTLHFLANARRLETLKIMLLPMIGYIMEWLPLNVPAFPNLTSLELEIYYMDSVDPGVRTIVSALHSVRRTLSFLSVKFQSGTFAEYDMHKRLEIADMPSLRRLVLSDDAPCVVLEHIRAPALEEIVYRLGSDFFRGSISHLRSALLCAPARVKQLSICLSYPSLGPDELVRCLKLLPDLEELSVDDALGERPPMLITEGFLRRMTCAEDERPLVPKLTKLTLNMACGGDDWKSIDHGLKSMLESRRAPRNFASVEVVALKDVRIFFGGKENTPI
ncbi:uncharacterized protein SCHCODRAFT_02581995 [Schizophyllum commune H4-8]|uniref:uncharacterized protein n=1 Tax=Schizophyllum commune (strain H4-8 / FGSC 9210) TaxID=578458 RepID=UPI002160BF74|nr:uncharacterized protein SCHCODRAFT_02581995 [Schizophyllum commune H4-8]KAI5891824.1 hypothetical protein SCHCODRAFT_02581995 [Schizophyllum commune H4-8]